MAAPVESEMSVGCNVNPETKHPLQPNQREYPTVVERYYTAGYIAGNELWVQELWLVSKEVNALTDGIFLYCDLFLSFPSSRVLSTL